MLWVFALLDVALLARVLLAQPALESTTSVGPDRLEDEHDVTLRLRQLVDTQGQVVHGDPGDVDAT
jgi:hypothetical protein